MWLIDLNYLELTISYSQSTAVYLSNPPPCSFYGELNLTQKISVLDTNGNALGHVQVAPYGNACTVLLSQPYVP